MTLSSGGSEIVCLVRSLNRQQSDELLLQRLPATSQVLTLATHAVLHRFADRESEWSAFGHQLTEAQSSQLAGPAPAGAAGCSAVETGVLRDLEIAQKYMLRVTGRGEDQRLVSAAFYVQAQFLAAGILSREAKFIRSVRRLYDRSGQA